MRTFIADLFGKSPSGSIVEHCRKADKMSRKLSRMVLALEGTESIFNILFYGKMILKLGDIASQSK